MKRRHFAVITHLLNGHTYPVLPLCSELVKRGHRVTYATSSHYARVVATTGAEAVVLKDRLIPKDVEEQVRLLDLPLSDPRTTPANRIVHQFFHTHAAEIVSQVESFYKDNPPDLILYDRYHIAGRILAARLNIPAVQISPSFAFYKNLAFRENGVCGNPDLILELSKDLDSFLATQGLTSRDSWWHVENLNIHFIPRQFQYHSDYFDERFCFVGAHLDRPFQPVWADRSNGKPLLLISGLSAPPNLSMDLRSYFRTFAEALAESDYHCVLSVADGESPGDLPSNFEINRHASHLEILPHADLAISHGGLSTTLEAICSGVPTLMVPQNAACEEVAYRTEELGLGIQIRKEELTIQNIKNTVHAMLDNTSLLKRAKDMQHEFRHSGGAGLTASRLEAYLIG